jgi:undecaprenyl-diphosphatase
MLAAFAVFVAVLLVVVAGGDERGVIDERAASFVVEHREPWLTDVLDRLTWLGSLAVLVPLLLIAGLALWRSRGTPTPLLVLMATVAGSTLLSNVVKLAVARDRPEDALVEAAGHAFPSGHATASAACWLTLAAVLAGPDASRRRRAGLLTVALAVIAIVGFSRVYLRAHEATDVLGGWALGSLWVLVVLTVATRHRRGR